MAEWKVDQRIGSVPGAIATGSIVGYETHPVAIAPGTDPIQVRKRPAS